MTHFTHYADHKFEVLRRHGFVVERESVMQVLELPDIIDDTRRPLVYAQRKIDTHHTLRVVFKNEAGATRVITFYPVRHEQ
ncbi:hypothetical protein HY250_00860 [Candidatus Azambacteria bacterium]|nr:hypothetical protein [Candidatus Azambacteria bacterium]MBI3684942.1 hypothetical protein [Candidatus Azambacteria bacterium]